MRPQARTAANEAANEAEKRRRAEEAEALRMRNLEELAEKNRAGLGLRRIHRDGERRAGAEVDEAAETAGAAPEESAAARKARVATLQAANREALEKRKRVEDPDEVKKAYGATGSDRRLRRWADGIE